MHCLSGDNYESIVTMHTNFSVSRPTLHLFQRLFLNQFWKLVAAWLFNRRLTCTGQLVSIHMVSCAHDVRLGGPISGRRQPLAGPGAAVSNQQLSRGRRAAWSSDEGCSSICAVKSEICELWFSCYEWGSLWPAGRTNRAYTRGRDASLPLRAQCKWARPVQCACTCEQTFCGRCFLYLNTFICL